MSVAAIGSGNWGKNIVRTLNELGALAAIVETSPDLRSKAAEEYPNAKIYDNLEPVLHSDITAVTIATPAQTHFSIARAALIAGKDVFVEKPITLSSEEAEDLCRLAEESGRILMVGHLLLYQPAVQAMAAMIQDGGIGNLISIHQERLNLGKARSVENVLWSLGVHDVAVAMFLSNSALGLDGAALGVGNAVLNPGVEDDFYLHCQLVNGVQTHLHCSWLWPERRRRTVVIGSTAMLVYDELAQTVTLHKKSIDANLNNVDNGEAVVFEGAGEPLRLEMEHFLHCVETRDKPKSDGWSALEVVRAMEMA